MKKNTFKSLLPFLCLFAVMSISAQQKQKGKMSNSLQLTEDNQRFLEEYGVVRCATVENESRLQQKFSKRATAEQFESFLAPIIAKIKSDRAAGKSQLAVYNIPVVVHVLHNGEAVGTAPNITDAQVISQIDVFNEDFRMSGGLGATNSTGVAIDSEINFCLAQQDAAGNPTTGINRVNIGQDGYTSTAAVDADKPATQWDPTKYMNMWSVKFTGAASTLLGYAQFPDPAATGVTGLGATVGGVGPANTDGVVAVYSTFGDSAKDDGSFLLNAPYDRGRTMTHEVGHWLGLRHIWGDGACGVDDYCADTPESDASNGGCLTTHTSCGTLDMVQNYMDYSNDTCMDTFTQDQKDRMQAIMAGSPRRMELNSSIGCQSPSTVTFTLVATPVSQTNCGNVSIDYTIDMTALNGFSEATTFTATGVPAGATVLFTPATLNSTSSTVLTLGSLGALADGSYPITVTGTSTSVTQNVNITLVVGSDVCAGQATSAYATSVTRVAFNTIDYTSSLTDADSQDGVGYSDFTGTQSTTVNRDDSYPLTVQVNTDGNYTIASKVWIDWNQNCVFDVATEEYDLGDATNVANGATGISGLSVTVPTDAVLGNTIMRVIARYAGTGGGIPEACISNTDGEVEDYRIIVDNSLSVDNNVFGVNDFSVYPNPSSSGIFNLSVNTTDNAKIKLFDIRGRNVYSELHTNNSDTLEAKLDFSTMASGVYLLNVNSGDIKATKKLVIQ